VEHSVPSAYTSLVAFEVDEKKRDEMGSHYDDEKKSGDSGPEKRKQFKLKNNKKAVAAIAVGGTLAVVAAGIMSFGDVTATMDNVPILGDSDLGGLDVDCCELDGDCDCCDDCDCGDCSIM